MQSILLYSMVFSRWGRHSTYMRRDAGEEGGREFSSKKPRTISNLPDFPRRPFLYVHLLYSKSMRRKVSKCRATSFEYRSVTWVTVLQQEVLKVKKMVILIVLLCPNIPMI